MQSDTKFASDLNYHTLNIEEAKQFLAKHEVTEIPTFLENVKHEYEEGENRFSVRVDGQKFQFTSHAYMEFCKHIGIPPKFADKIPNHLLMECVDQMLGGEENEKVRFLIRDQNVICGCKRDSYVNTNPTEFLSASESLMENHMFREASISDFGTSLLYEPMSGQTISPSIENQEDRFNVGVAFTLGFSQALVEARPYSLRHACINVAISASEVPKYNLVEKIKKKGSPRYYSRLLENYSSDRYQQYMQELSNRIAKAIGEPMTDWSYYETFKPLNRLLGKEVALAIIGVNEEQHQSIVTDIKYKAAKDLFTKEREVKLENLGVYDVFNSVTAAAKGYSGLERVALQEIGGSLI